MILDRYALASWTRANRRATDEYHLMPTVSGRTAHGPYITLCGRVSRYLDGLCAVCRKDRP